MGLYQVESHPGQKKIYVSRNTLSKDYFYVSGGDLEASALNNTGEGLGAHHCWLHKVRSLKENEVIYLCSLCWPNHLFYFGSSFSRHQRVHFSARHKCSKSRSISSQFLGPRGIMVVSNELHVTYLSLVRYFLPLVIEYDVKYIGVEASLPGPHEIEDIVIEALLTLDKDGRYRNKLRQALQETCKPTLMVV